MADRDTPAHAAAEERLHRVAQELADVPGVVLPADGRRHVGTAMLRVEGRIAAFTPEDRLVVKLPADRVAALVASGDGCPSRRAGRRCASGWRSRRTTPTSGGCCSGSP
ncbi:hypothetical protein [Cellulomonas sp. KH9]|uniref:hypothetical protein n=1 Tax=Cellulomonas sp. KH9 TaxID=1855324 RepID=UPI0008E70BB3|nr:hypothetical protein [Cellulomonas sp. KH9]SFK15607.1 hypothetical protein SAMN05216467_2230 [Cellulomonas sp. KH9]